MILNNEGKKYLQMLKAKENIWTTTKGEKIKGIHPPQENVQLSLTMEATPYKDVSSINDKTPIKPEFFAHIMKQNNFTNLYLQSIAEQTNRIEEKIENKNPTEEPKKEKEKLIIEKSFTNSKRLDPNIILKKEPIKLDSGNELIMHLKKKLKTLDDTPSISMIKIESNEDTEIIEINKLKFKNQNNLRPNFLKMEQPQTISPKLF